MKFLDRLMAKLGYVPRYAADSVCSLKIDVDTSQVREALEPVQQLTVAATEAEAALAKLWNIQAAMQNRSPSTGSGGVSSSIGSAPKSSSRMAALNELAERSGAIGICAINEASAVAGQRESPQTD